MNKKEKFTDQQLEKISFIIDNVNKVNSLVELNRLANDNLSLNDLKNAKRFLRKRVNVYSILKKQYFTINDMTKYHEYRKLQNRCKSLIKVINKLNVSVVDEKKYNKIENRQTDISRTEMRRQLVVDNILMLDYFHQASDEVLFKRYLKCSDFDEKVRILHELRGRYLTATYNLYRAKKDIVEKIYRIVARENGLSGKLDKNKKEFKLLLETDNYKEYKKNIDSIKIKYNKCKIFLNNIERLLDFENLIYNDNIPKKNYELDETDYNELLKDVYPNCKELVDRLNNIRSGRYSRRYGTSISNFIPKDLEHLFKTLEDLDYETLMEVSLFGIDVVKNKLRTIKKGKNEYDDAEREFLKKVVKRFEELKPFIPFEEIIDTSVYYDILETLIYNDNNFTYLEKLIKQIDGCKNARKDNEHIIIKLIDNFIMNYKLKLINQRFEYIEPDFYKELVKVFYENDVSLKDEEKEKIRVMLDEFEAYCKKRKYVSLGNVVSDINELRGGNIKKDRSSIDKAKLEQEEKFLEFYIDNVVSYYTRRGYPKYYDSEKSSVFMFDEIDNVAFSVAYSDDGNVNLGVHLLDTSKIVSEDSEMIKALLRGKKVLPKLDMDRVYPVMSFTYSLIDGYKLSNMRLKPGLIKINKNYTENDLVNYKEKVDLKLLLMVLHQMYDNKDDVDIYSEDGIKEVVFDFLSNDLKRKFEVKGIPFIYEKKLENGGELVRDNHNQVCNELMKIPKTEAYRIFNILDNVVDRYYVPEINGESKINFDNDFLKHYLLNIVNKIQNNNYEIGKEVETMIEYLTKLNGNRRYLPVDIVRKNQSKLTKIARQYKRR